MDSVDLIRMARVIITLHIMPESPEVNLKNIEVAALAEIKRFAGECETRTSIEPIAFGLSAVKIIFVMDENIGSTEQLEKNIAKLNGVSSVEVTDIRRAVG